MKMKILNIKGCKTCNQVLVFIDRGDEGDQVAIVAWHYTEENGNLIQEAFVSLTSNQEFSDLERFVADYSQESANAFANSMRF